MVCRYPTERTRSYVRCGVLAHGFRVGDAAGATMICSLAFRAKAVHPSCGVRRMNEEGADLVDRIFPDVPYRQWVLSLPWELRGLCARRADVLTAVARLL